MINKAILLGNVGQQPEIRQTSDGKDVATLSIATSEYWKDKATGERKEKTEWHRVVVFGGAASFVKNYVNKGSKVYIEGQLQTRKWTDKTGIDKYSTEIVIQNYKGVIQNLTPKKDNSPVTENDLMENFDGEVIIDDQIPF